MYSKQALEYPCGTGEHRKVEIRTMLAVIEAEEQEYCYNFVQPCRF